MVYKIIKGTFHVKGFSPDGDSIRFQALNEDNWKFFKWGKNKQPKKGQSAQLRLEAIDALETHYEESHQPRSFGIAALEVLLSQLGISDITYNLAITKITSAQDGTPGFIASAGLDMYGRPISLLFTKDAPLNDGDELTMDKLLPMLDGSCVNLRMLKKGLVYPTFYSSMEPPLQAVFAKATKTCRNELVGLWALDKSKEFTIWNISTLTDDIVILPKLFRRLTTFIQDRSDFSELADYMKKQKDPVKLVTTGEKTDLGKLLEIKQRNIKFKIDFEPENLIFDPKD